MEVKGKILYLWGVFLVLGIILFSMQIYHTLKLLKKENNNNN